jgi:hypothetical protein
MPCSSTWPQAGNSLGLTSPVGLSRPQLIATIDLIIHISVLIENQLPREP